ncbi:MAG: DUF1080 domain-containing protein [Gemmataceae bacterium]|nr:DUF1080 domain-containing protein [Gemmataceae bacterium]MDW8267002.1 DUF1080 domain-containing protein [Gemmataceae bacterium]
MHRASPRWALGAYLWVVASVGAAGLADADGWIDLTGGDEPLKHWQDPATEWIIAGDAVLDPQMPRWLEAKPGRGVLVNGPKGRIKNLVTKQKFADIEAHVEFVIPKGSNSGVKFMGLYEIQIVDSHGAKELHGHSCGGIYPRAEHLPKYHHIDDGTPPRVNAAKPAGEWQSLDVVFQAPRFDADGKKVRHARFVRVVLNGQLIHENVEVAHPTGAAWRLSRETATGPLLLQADHGAVAFRNVRIRPVSLPAR